MSERPNSWVRDHLANERTLLAWVRTAISFMIFGLGIAKLSVLLAVDVAEHPAIADSLPDASVSQLVGAALIAVGGLIAVMGAVETRKWAKEIPGDPPNASTSILTAGIAILTSVGLLAYLLL